MPALKIMLAAQRQRGNELICQYLEGKIKREHIQKVLGIGKTRFLQLLKNIEMTPDFSIEYIRKNATNKISFEIEENIMAELQKKN